MAATPSNDTFKPVKSADRTLEILERLAEATDRLTLAELSTALDIPKSSLHAILRTMEQRRWVATDPSGRQFGLGVRAVEVGASYVDTDDTVVRMEPILDSLSEELGETIHLGRLDDDDIVYLAKRESRHPLRLYSAIGRRLPAHATALGKAILSTLDPGSVDTVLRTPLQPLTANTITDMPALQRELATIRDRGYAIDEEENTEGIRCFAATVPSGQRVPDAISVSVPVMRLDPELQERVVAALQAASERGRATLRRYR